VCVSCQTTLIGLVVAYEIPYFEIMPAHILRRVTCSLS